MFGIDFLGFARDLYNMFMDMFVKFIAFSIDFSGVKLVQDMLGNAEGVGLVLAGYVAITMVLASIVAKRFRFNAIVSFFVIAMAPVLFSIWLAMLDGLRAIGAGLLGVIVGVDVSEIRSNIVIPFPALDITAAMWNVPVFIGSAGMGFWFMCVFAMMALLNIVIGILGIWFISLYGFGPRSRRALSITVSLALVTFCIGQPTVVAIIKLANFVGNLAPVIPGSVGLAGLFTLAGMYLAGWVLLALPFVMYFPVHNVMGRMVSAVSNRVRTQVDNKPRVDAKVNGNVNTTQNNRLGSTQRAAYRAQRASQMRQGIGNTGSAALTGLLKKLTVSAAAAGSNVHPVAKVAFVATAVAVKGWGNAPKKPKERDRDVYR